MGGVRDEVGARLVGDLTEGGVVHVPGIGDGTADDGFGAMRTGEGAHLLVVDEPALRVHPVGDEVEPAPGEVGGRPVGEMAAVGQPEGEDGVTGAQEGGVGGQNGRRPAVGLDVGVFGPEERPGPFHGDAFGDVDDLAAAVVPGAGIPLGVLVGQRRAERGQHGRRGEVLGGDQLERRRLPFDLPEQHLGKLGVLPAQYLNSDIALKGTRDRHGGLRTSTVTYVQCRPGRAGAPGAPTNRLRTRRDPRQCRHHRVQRLLYLVPDRPEERQGRPVRVVHLVRLRGGREKPPA